MIKKPSLFVVVLVAFIVFSVGYTVYQYIVTPRVTVLTSGPIFQAQLPDLNGVRQPLKQWRGKVLVVNFWAAWCHPCQQEIPGFIQLQQQYAAQGLQIVGIAIDEKSAVQTYADKVGINYPILLGDLEAVALSRASGNYIGGLPYTVIIDPQGKLVSAGAGGISKEELSRLIVPLLQNH